MRQEEYKALVQAARETDLVTYFQQNGFTVERKGSEFYVKEYPSLCIKPSTNQWYFHYTREGATNNSINCLTKVLGMDFNQAVFSLTGQDISRMRAADFPRAQRPAMTTPPRTPRRELEKKELHMPEQSEKTGRLFAYLCQTRKIPPHIVEELLHIGLLYQSENTVQCERDGHERTFRNANAVFVHRDAQGEAIGAEIQGLNSFKRFKGMAPGTGDTVFMFTPMPARDGKLRRAYLFESAIDLMSFYSFCEQKSLLTGSALISMAGLKPTVPKQLQAEGVQIISCVDADDAGKRFEHDNGFDRSESVRQKLDDLGFKDWNERLTFVANHPDIDLRTVHREQVEQITARRMH